MYAEMLTLPPRATDGANKPVPNARWYFFASGTSKPLPAYSDAALVIQHPNPLVCDNAGACPPVYFDPQKSYRAVLRSANGKTVLADIDPANTNLGATPYARPQTYRENAVGAVDRPISDKLQDAPVDVGDFGALDRTGGSDMTAIFGAAYAAAAASGRPLRLPAGKFAVSGLMWDKNVEVFGQGAGQTIFVPTGDDQTVISITGDDLPGDRTLKRVIRDFSIHLHGHVRCTGLSTSFLLRTTLQRIGIRSADADFFTDDAGYDRWAAIDNVGWVSLADQYCMFEEIHIERVRLGFVLRPDQFAGAGVNNIFSGLHICYVQVGAMMFDNVGYGVGLNFFENFKLQVCTHCALYARNIGPTTMTGIPIEFSGYQRAAISLQGETVKGCSMQISRSHFRIESSTIAAWQLGWPNIMPPLPYPMIVEDHSRVVMPNCQAVGLLSVDDTSTCEFDGMYSNGAQLVGASLRLQARGSYANAAALTPLDFSIDRTLGNDARTPMDPIAIVAPDVVKTLNSDPALGVMTRVAFSASPSSAPDAGVTTNAVQIFPIEGSYQAGDQAVISLPVKAETDTVLTIFPPGFGRWTFPVKAGQWHRLFFTNCMDGDGGGWMVIGPAGSDAPVVTFGPLMSVKNATSTTFRQLSEGHRLNPMDPDGPALRAAAPPAAGSWHAGAKVYNIDPAATILAWRCTQAGTPGTWEAISRIARKAAAVTPAAGYALPGDNSAMQVRVSDTNAVIQGRVIKAEPGQIGFGTTVALVPAGFRPLTYLRPIMVCVNDGGSEWDTVPAQLDPYTGSLTLIGGSSVLATEINVNAAFAVAPPD